MATAQWSFAQATGLVAASLLSHAPSKERDRVADLSVRLDYGVDTFLSQH